MCRVVCVCVCVCAEQLQSTMLTTMCALTEGPSDSEVVSQCVSALVRRLEFPALSDLLWHALQPAERYLHSSPCTLELSLATDTERLSGGVWDQLFSPGDLCVAYVPATQCAHFARKRPHVFRVMPDVLFPYSWVSSHSFCVFHFASHGHHKLLCVPLCFARA